MDKREGFFWIIMGGVVAATVVGLLLRIGKRIAKRIHGWLTKT